MLANVRPQCRLLYRKKKDHSLMLWQFCVHFPLASDGSFIQGAAVTPAHGRRRRFLHGFCSNLLPWFKLPSGSSSFPLLLVPVSCPLHQLHSPPSFQLLSPLLLFQFRSPAYCFTSTLLPIVSNSVSCPLFQLHSPPLCFNFSLLPIALIPLFSYCFSFTLLPIVLDPLLSIVSAPTSCLLSNF